MDSSRPADLRLEVDGDIDFAVAPAQVRLMIGQDTRGLATGHCTAENRTLDPD